MKHWVFYWEIGTFHPILYGKFTLITDQKHLVKTPEPRRDGAASSWQITEVGSRVGSVLPLHQVAHKHRDADTRSRVPLQADRAPPSDLTCSISPCRKVLLLQKRLQQVDTVLEEICLHSEAGEQSRLLANISGVWCQIYWKSITVGVSSNLCHCRSWRRYQFLPEMESWDPKESAGAEHRSTF